MKKTIVIVALIAIALCLIVAGKEELSLDAKARARLPGAFLTLSQGRVHYELTGPLDGKPVVLVHGFSSPMFVWDNMAPYLASKGFRVLRFDLYGRGLSDRPDVAYDVETYDQELFDLIRALDLATPVDLVGLSMGGAISVNFCARHPELVDRLVLIGPAGMPQKEPFLMSLVKVPGLGEALIAGLGGFTIKKGAEKSLYNKGLVPQFAEKFFPQTQYKGYKRAILRTLRNFPLFDLEKAYLALGSQKRKVLLVWGEADVIVPFENGEKVLSAVPGADFLPVAGSGHMPQYEKPEVVNPAVSAFLSQGAMPSARAGEPGNPQ